MIEIDTNQMWDYDGTSNMMLDAGDLNSLAVGTTKPFPASSSSSSSSSSTTLPPTSSSSSSSSSPTTETIFHPFQYETATGKSTLSLFNHCNNNDDDDDDVIMQMDADEGLLDLNEFYDSISADTSPPEQLLADAMLTSTTLDYDSSSASSDANSFFSCENDGYNNNNNNSSPSSPSTSSSSPTSPDGHNDNHHSWSAMLSSNMEFQESLRKLSNSMQKSQATRQSLYAKTPKLKDYQRSGTVEKVLKRIEYSSQQIDTYYYSSMRGALQ